MELDFLERSAPGLKSWLTDRGGYLFEDGPARFTLQCSSSMRRVHDEWSDEQASALNIDPTPYRRSIMNRCMLGMVAVIALASTGAWAQAAPQSAEESKAAVARAEADYRLAANVALTSGGTTKAICVDEAKAAEKRAKADACMVAQRIPIRHATTLAWVRRPTTWWPRSAAASKAATRDICMEEAGPPGPKAEADAKASATTGSALPGK